MRSRRSWLGLGALAVLAACHKYVPVNASTPPVGDVVAFTITDQGRVALFERLGPGVATIEGRVVGTEDNNYLVSVARVEQVNGTASRWSGEVMRLDRGFIDHFRRRELSKTRTWLLAGGVTAAVTALIATKGLTAIFGGDDPAPPPTEPPQQKTGRRTRP